MIAYDREIISLGSRGSLNVDRAIAEFRSGRPVLLRDNNRVVLTLSAKGRRVHDKIEMVVSAMESEILSALTAEERKALGSSLDKLEQTSLKFGRREGWYDRRQLAGDTSRRAKPDARRPAKQAGRAVGGKLVGAK